MPVARRFVSTSASRSFHSRSGSGSNTLGNSWQEITPGGQPLYRSHTGVPISNGFMAAAGRTVAAKVWASAKSANRMSSGIARVTCLVREIDTFTLPPEYCTERNVPSAIPIDRPRRATMSLGSGSPPDYQSNGHQAIGGPANRLERRRVSRVYLA